MYDLTNSPEAKMPDDQRSSRKRSLPLLVVEDDKDHQLIIQYSLLVSMPQAEAMFASTAEEALVYLQTTSIDQATFPRILLLDIYLPDAPIGWQLLREIRVKYPLLPVVVLSGSQDEAVVRQAYEMGVSSFLAKPSNLENWERCFQVFNIYWSTIVTLPPGST